MKSIRLCYRKVIETDSRSAWEKAVFDATHLEFYMQAQRLDPEGKYATFKALSEHITAAAQLHYLTSAAVIGYIRHLNDVIPDIYNTLGLTCLSFHDFKFEIIASHIEEKAQHRIAISFYSDPFLWLDTIGNSLLITKESNSEKLRTGVSIETDLILLGSSLSISHYINH
jgi:hypothetical protein